MPLTMSENIARNMQSSQGIINYPTHLHLVGYFHILRTERSKIFVPNFLSGLFTDQTQKPDQDDTPGGATPATVKGPVLSTVFEIPRWVINCYGPTMATLL